MSRSAKKSHFPNPYLYVSVGLGGGVNLQKYKEFNKMFRSAKKYHVCQLPYLMGAGVNLQK